MNKGFSMVGLMVTVLVLGALVSLIMIPVLGLHWENGRGEQTGYITAVEKTGLIFKTGRAYIKTDTSSSQEDVYCVVDEEVYKQLSDKSKSREKVTIQHFSWLAAGVSNCEGEGAVIYAVN